MHKITVTDYLDTKYLEYAKGVVEDRAIPSVVDGFKPVHRKIITAALQKAKHKYYKIFQLTGIVASEMNYAHGDASLNGSIINMSQDFKNSLPYFDRDGQFGSLRSPEAGAPRYIGVKVNDVFSKLFRDLNIVDYKYEEGQKIEPELYYPIIPTVLLNGQKGIAVGHGSEVLNRNPLDLVNTITSLVKTGKWQEPGLYLKGFNGNIVLNEEHSWEYRGLYEVINTTTLKITEIPPSKSFEDYELILHKLIEKGIIKSYEDNSAEYPDFTIRLERKVLAELIEKDSIMKVFSLSERKGENLTLLDEHFKIIKFANIQQLCEYFVNYRMSIYTKRKEVLLKDWNYTLNINRNLIRFIEMYIKGDLKIAKRPIDEILAELETLKFDKIDNSYEYLIRLSLKRLTKEELLKLKTEIELVKADISDLEKKNEKDLYLSDLVELKKDLTKLMK